MKKTQPQHVGFFGKILQFLNKHGHEIFITAVGLAALAHSTWTLGTIFAGVQPEGLIESILWLIPAFLIAFALDIGQIATSANIRNNGGNFAKYLTFGTFAIATYYLQWIYVMHHIPILELGAGVRVSFVPMVELGRDLAIFAVPALLPLSTMLYTFSANDTHDNEVNTPDNTLDLIVSSEHPVLSEKTVTNEVNTPDNTLDQDQGVNRVSSNHFVAYCKLCDWSGNYKTESSAKRALTMHNNRTHEDQEIEDIDKAETITAPETALDQDQDTEPIAITLNGHKST